MSWETLHCRQGDHDWRRPTKKGPKPVNCPEHKAPVEVDSVKAAERLARLAEARRIATLRKAEEAATQVRAMTDWIKQDAQYYRIKREIEAGLRDKHDLPSRPLAVTIPSDHQYKLAREHGLIP